MNSSAISGRTRPGFNFTELSTASLLLGVSATCVMLWVIIASTVTG
jgi:hypothetical protein